MKRVELRDKIAKYLCNKIMQRDDHLGSVRHANVLMETIEDAMRSVKLKEAGLSIWGIEDDSED